MTKIKHRTEWLNSTVLGAGITSALGDFAYETASVILPGFLAVLGIPAAALGAIEGVADAISSFTKLGAGFFSDRLGRKKPVVIIGYTLTAVAQIFFAIASSWIFILLGRVIAWLGKGIRGPLRDAILTDAISADTRGRAFGFHRAADTLGAVLGPLLGIGLLTLFKNASIFDAAQPFRNVFWLTLIPGMLSVLSFTILVKEKRKIKNTHLRFWQSIRSFPLNFRKYLIAVGIFGMGDFAHTLLILAATQLLSHNRSIIHATQIAGLLYVVRNITQTLAAYPAGHLADKYGHKMMLIIGYFLGALTATLTTFAFLFHLSSILYLALIFLLAGIYIAIQDTLEASMTADFVPKELRGTGYGLLGAINGIGDLFSSTIVGLLWTAISPVAGFAFATFTMGIGTLMMSTFNPNKRKAR